MVPAEERLNTTAVSGRDNFFPIRIGNAGTAAIDNIKFSAPTKPTGWAVQFSPDSIDRMDALKTLTIDVNIKPPARTIAGDYMIALRASGEQTSANDIEIRVTAESPTIWGWVGVGIILVVVAFLAIVLMRFSRR
jgi:uncharacterized membrane protein